jgi:hypothetical protein
MCLLTYRDSLNTLIVYGRRKQTFGSHSIRPVKIENMQHRELFMKYDVKYRVVLITIHIPKIVIIVIRGYTVA